MALLSRVKSPDWISGEILTHTDLIAEFNNIVNGLNGGADISVLDITCDDITMDALTANSVAIGSVNVALAMPPIGSIIPFYDFDGALTFSSSYWVYCDGSTATVGGSSRTLPDLSGRYLVGFGGATDGAGDIDTATWSTAVVGNSLHQVDLSHTHDTNVASFTSGAGSAHSHGAGTYIAEIGAETGGTTRIVVSLTGTSFSGSDRWATGGIGMDGTNSTSDSAVDVSGTSSTESAHTHAIDPPITTSTSGGSATQSIQPRSIRVRFIMRKA